MWNGVRLGRNFVITKTQSNKIRTKSNSNTTVNDTVHLWLKALSQKVMEKMDTGNRQTNIVCTLGRWRIWLMIMVLVLLDSTSLRATVKATRPAWIACARLLPTRRKVLVGDLCCHQIWSSPFLWQSFSYLLFFSRFVSCLDGYQRTWNPIWFLHQWCQED